MTNNYEHAQGDRQTSAYTEAVIDLIVAAIANLHEATLLLRLINADPLLLIQIEKARKEIRNVWKEYRQRGIKANS